MEYIELSHGGGGKQSNDLIKQMFFKHFSNDILLSNEDAACLHVNKKIAFSTDSFTVNPIFFNGGDIGKLSIAGTVNDLVMAGAKPLYLSAAFIIEEGFCLNELEKIVISMKNEMQKSGVKIVTGDTKVVPKSHVDKIFINTAGIGEIVCENISANNLANGQKIILSNQIGKHGSCILTQREGLEFEGDLQSDCASLWSVLKKVFDKNIKITALRDATRGGLSAVLNEWANASNVGIEINEELIPVSNEVKGVCEFLGFEPYELANEGTFLMCVDDEKAVLEILKNDPLTKHASCIGEVNMEHKNKVVLKNSWGSKRFLDYPSGELLPRIC